MSMQAYTSSMAQFTTDPAKSEGQEVQATSGAEEGRSATPSSQSGRVKKSASAFRTISEVSKELGVQQHVLRFWETKFSQVRPLKRGGGRRYYRPEDVELLKRIHELLYTEGYTIKGVQKLMREQGKNAVLSGVGGVVDARDAEVVQKVQQGPGLNDSQKAILEAMLDELKALRQMVAEDCAAVDA